MKTFISRSEYDSHLAIEWFESNYMKLKSRQTPYISFGEAKISKSLKQTLLGVVIDRDLSFD